MFLQNPALARVSKTSSRLRLLLRTCAAGLIGTIGVVSAPSLSGQTQQYWDGADTTGNSIIEGGTGDWDNTTMNWTNSTGTINSPWAGQGAIFGGVASGTVSVTQNVDFRSLRFVLDGYLVDSTGGDLVAIDNTSIISDPGVTAEISAAITGTGNDSVEIGGGGTVILSGTNTYGGGTVLSAGTLQIENSDALGTGDFFVQDGTTILSAGGFDVTNRLFLQGDVSMLGFANSFSGETILGNSVRTVTLDGAVAFNNAITGGSNSGLYIRSSTLGLVLFSGSANNNFGSLRIGSNVDVILAMDPGVVGISGNLRIDNGGQLDVMYDSGDAPIAANTRLRLDGRIDFDSLTTLDITFARLTGAATGELCNFCSLSPLNLTILSGNYAGMIFDEEFGLSGGVLTLIKDGTGTLTLSGNNTYRGRTLVNGGRLIAASNTAISNTAVTVRGGSSVLQINRRVTLANPLTLNNKGTLDNFGIYNGNITIGSRGGGILNQSGGRINGSIVTTGSVTMEVRGGSFFSGDLNFGKSESALILGGSGDSTVNDVIGGRISGRYGLVKAGSGEWTLDRDLTPRLGTVIDQGTLTIGNKGSLKGDIVNNGELRVDRSRDYTFEGAIFGNGDLIQDGTSNTILLGEMSYTGTTYVHSGGIIMGNRREAGSLAGGVMVAAGAFFSGEGTISGSFTSAGMISPGYSPGRLEIRDNFTLRSTATLVIEINSAKNFDRLIVGKNAKVDGTLRVVLSGRYNPEIGTSFVIITAKSVKGEFDGLRGSSMWETVYGPKTVTLVFGRRPYQFYAETPNQHNVAVALETLRTQDLGDNTDFNNNVRPILDSLTPNELRQAFEEILPTQSAAFADTSFARSRVFLPQMATRLADIRAGSRGFVASGFNQLGAADMKDVLAPTPENRWGVWVDGSGVFSEVAGFDGLRTGDATGASATVGVDYRVNDNFTVGLYTGYVGSWTDFGGNSEVDSNGTRFGIYSTYQNGGFYLNNVIGGEWNSYDWRRGINLPGLSRTARADTQGTVFETMFGGGYDWKVCEWGAVGAFTALEYTLLNVDGFREKGAQSLNLKIRDQDADSLRTNLGLQFTGDLPIGQRRLRPSLRAAWRHEYLDGSRRINSTLVGGAGPGFSTLLPGGSRKDSLLLNGGFSMELTENVSGYLYYTGDIAGGESENIHAVNAGLRLAF